MKPVDSGARARLKSVLDPEKLKKYKEDEVPLVPLVPPLCVFEYNTLFYKQTEVSLEQSGGKPELSNIRFYSVLPQDTLLAGKEATFEFPFQIPEVNGSGIMTIRYFPVKRK
jgi:hypothetical protein